MAWTATITDVQPAGGTIQVTVAFTEGATTFRQSFTFDADVSLAAAKTQMQEIKPELIAALNKAKAAQALIGTVI